MQRRSFSAALLSTCAGSLLPSLVSAQGSWPSKPVRFIIPYAAGGQPDVTARALSVRLGEQLGQPIVVDNRPGAGGSVAFNTLAQVQPNDGHAFIVSDAAMLSISPLISKATNYKLGKDLVPVALIGRSSLFLVAHPKTGVNTLPEFVETVRKRPGEFTYGSSGIGSNHHLTMEALKAALNLDIRHVPYKGSGQSTPALVSGQVDFSIAALPSVAGFVQQGQVKLLGRIQLPAPSWRRMFRRCPTSCPASTSRPCSWCWERRHTAAGHRSTVQGDHADRQAARCHQVPEYRRGGTESGRPGRPHPRTESRNCCHGQGCERREAAGGIRLPSLGRA